MINFYSGRPGNGKSLHMAMEIYRAMKKGKNVIANFEINERYFLKFDRKHPGKLGHFIYMPPEYWNYNCIGLCRNREHRVTEPPSGVFSYIEGLKNFALQFHKKNRRGQIIEGQTLLVLDECADDYLFNSRSWNRKDRLAWVQFFRQHRKYGYEVYLIAQDDKSIDKQIRGILQTEYEHRLVNNYKLFGKILGFLAGGRLFVVVQKNYAVKGKNARTKSSFFTAEKFYNFYDSYKIFSASGGARAPCGDS